MLRSFAQGWTYLDKPTEVFYVQPDIASPSTLPELTGDPICRFSIEMVRGSTARENVGRATALYYHLMKATNGLRGKYVMVIFLHYCRGVGQMTLNAVAYRAMER